MKKNIFNIWIGIFKVSKKYITLWTEKVALNMGYIATSWNIAVLLPPQWLHNLQRRQNT